jgi:hypothetical protein
MCGYSAPFIMHICAFRGIATHLRQFASNPIMATKHIDTLRDRKALVKQLTALLDGGQAHVSFADAVKGFPAKLRGTVPDKLPYSAWQLLEHLRIAQRDILDFSTNTKGTYQHKKWPEAYWPKEKAPPTAKAWDTSIETIDRDLKDFEKLLTARNADLYTPFPWGTGQNLLRQALLIADHNAYHIGELLVLRRLLGCWK